MVKKCDKEYQTPKQKFDFSYKALFSTLRKKQIAQFLNLITGHYKTTKKSIKLVVIHGKYLTLDRQTIEYIFVSQYI